MAQNFSKLWRGCCTCDPHFCGAGARQAGANPAPFEYFFGSGGFVSDPVISGQTISGVVKGGFGGGVSVWCNEPVAYPLHDLNASSGDTVELTGTAVIYLEALHNDSRIRFGFANDTWDADADTSISNDYATYRVRVTSPNDDWAGPLTVLGRAGTSDTTGTIPNVVGTTPTTVTLQAIYRFVIGTTTEVEADFAFNDETASLSDTTFGYKTECPNAGFIFIYYPPDTDPKEFSLTWTWSANRIVP